jgi:hypothetical protein
VGIRKYLSIYLQTYYAYVRVEAQLIIDLIIRCTEQQHKKLGYLELSCWTSYTH